MKTNQARILGGSRAGRALCLALLLPLALTACTAEQDASKTDSEATSQLVSQSELGETTWQLMAVGGEPVTLEDEARRPWLEFSPAENRVGGFAGCNRFFGDYQIDGHQITFKRMGATKMFCHGIMEVEGALLTALSQVRSWQLKQRSLILLDAQGTPAARFEARSPRKGE